MRPFDFCAISYDKEDALAKLDILQEYEEYGNIENMTDWTKNS